MFYTVLQNRSRKEPHHFDKAAPAPKQLLKMARI
jgi:hypothetical protein